MEHARGTYLVLLVVADLFPILRGVLGQLTGRLQGDITHGEVERQGSGVMFEVGAGVKTVERGGSTERPTGCEQHSRAPCGL